jgi:hypothetical protein
MQAAPPPAVVTFVKADKPAELPRIQIGCPQAGSGDIVVCGRRTALSYRLQPLPVLPAQSAAMERLRDRMTLQYRIGYAQVGVSSRSA